MTDHNAGNFEVLRRLNNHVINALHHDWVLTRGQLVVYHDVRLCNSARAKATRFFSPLLMESGRRSNMSATCSRSATSATAEQFLSLNVSGLHQRKGNIVLHDIESKRADP